MMMTDNTVTNDLADFGFRELGMVAELLRAYAGDGKNDLPPREYFSDEVRVYMNRNSGYVFLCDADANTAMMDGDTLRAFYSSPYEGREGFAHELADDYADMHPEDQEWFRHVANAEGIDLPEL